MLIFNVRAMMLTLSSHDCMQSAVSLHRELHVSSCIQYICARRTAHACLRWQRRGLEGKPRDMQKEDVHMVAARLGSYDRTYSMDALYN